MSSVKRLSTVISYGIGLISLFAILLRSIRISIHVPAFHVRLDLVITLELDRNSMTFEVCLFNEF